MVELRSYQKDLLSRTETALEATPNPRVMMQLPTGGGKTHIAAALMSERLKDGVKAVWLTHRWELATQTEGMLRQAGIPATSNIRWSPGIEAPSISNGVVILMAQTVCRRTARTNVWSVYNRKDLMIIDEAHHATADGWARAINQWPGSALGMTATPWRLSQREGFDHLFGELVCGPQIAALQVDGWLCQARVVSPPEQDRILGGRVDTTGDYNESGIEQANEDRDIWTAGALRFWQQHGDDRQTVVYAVSVRHARNLAGVFNDAGIPAGVLLGETPDTERADLISGFKDGRLKVLVNVAVATEGFDLPDAACVVLTRPTMSLSLYLQMVGRGLRPKPDGGDCVILDMAGNSFRHGLPEEDREWSLKPRGAPPPGECPVSRCPMCESISPAASHYCRNCGEPFGETCSRCGAWRAWVRWSRKTACGDAHEPVCDLCHYDAHVQAHLPVTEELEELAMLADDDELLPSRDPFLKNLLEEELLRVGGAAEERKAELRSLIRNRESEMADDNTLERAFEDHLARLSETERPQSRPQERRLFNRWEAGRNQELAVWRDELASLEESHPLDKQLVYNSARDRLMRLFDAEAREAGLLSEEHDSERPFEEGHRPAGKLVLKKSVQPTYQEYSSRVPNDSRSWTTLVELGDLGKDEIAGRRPLRIRSLGGEEIPVDNWVDLLVKTAEWLVEEGLLTEARCPVRVGNMNRRYLVNSTSIHPTGRLFGFIRRLSNGLYLEGQWGPEGVARRSNQLLRHFGQDPAQFHVLLR